MGLVKSGTTEPMCRSKVMPVQKFTDLFMSWSGNYALSIESLRLKCVTLLALTAMMRPSDPAPIAQCYQDGVFKSMVLSTKNISFHPDGSLTIVFHGIKNDYDRQGFEVNLPGASIPRICPVCALKC